MGEEDGVRDEVSKNTQFTANMLFTGYMYIHTYNYVCVCVCVCVYGRVESLRTDAVLLQMFHALVHYYNEQTNKNEGERK